jgi:hypothetical protein
MTLSDVGPQFAASHAARSLLRVTRKRPGARVSSQENKLSDDRRAHAWILLAGTVFREPHPATSAADRGFGGRSRQIHFVDLAMQRAARPVTGLSTTLFFHSGNTLAVLMPAMSV